MSKLPVTVLSGVLGAEQTTLLTPLLSHRDCNRMAVIVDNMNKVNIDTAGRRWRQGRKKPWRPGRTRR